MAGENWWDGDGIVVGDEEFDDIGDEYENGVGTVIRGGVIVPVVVLEFPFESMCLSLFGYRERERKEKNNFFVPPPFNKELIGR